MSTHKKHSVVVTILAALTTVVGVVLIWRYIKGKNPPVNNKDSIPDTPASNPIHAPASSFPVKVGSRNDLVKQLQAALGISADGIFGPKTLAALTAQTGKTSIASQSEFDAVISSLQNKPIVAANKNRADLLTSQWKNNNSLQLMALQKVSAAQVVKDASGALNPTGKSLSIAGNVKLSRKNYIPHGATTSGFLLFQVVNNAVSLLDLAISRAKPPAAEDGYYKVDPNKMTIA